MRLQTKIWLVASLVIIAIMASDYFGGYRRFEENIKSELKHDAKEVQAMLMAMRRVYHKQFVDSGLPINDNTVGFLPAHAISRISLDFPNWSQTGLSFNNVSDRPQNPRNLADAHELEAMAYFRANPKETERLAEIRDAKGKEFVHFTAPIWVEPYCMKCHGDRDQAPESIAKAYHNAFDYQVGELRGVMSIKVPADELRERLRKEWLQLFNARLAGYVVLLLLIGLSMKLMVTRRIGQVEKVAGRLANGDYAARTQVGGNDEVAELGRSFDHMADRIQADITALRDAETEIRQSETRFRTIFEQAAVGIAKVAPDGRWLSVNEKLCAIVGYREDELMKMRFQDITHPDDLNVDTEYGQQMLAGVRNTYTLEKRYLHKGGNMIWVRLTVSLVRQETGQPDYFISLVEDISELKAAEDQAQKATEEKLLILDAAGEGIFGLGNNGIFTFVNPAACQMLGFAADELIGHSCKDVYLHHRREGTPHSGDECPICKITRAVEEQSGEEYFFREDGSFFPVAYSSAPMRKAGRIVGWVVSFMDITEQKKTRDELSALNKNLEERITAELAKSREKDLLLMQQSRLASMGEMIHNISHHWRQPLNALAILLANIKDSHDYGELDSAVLGKSIGMGNQFIQKMSSTIDDFRNFFLPDAKPEPFDVAAAVQEALDILDASMENKLIALDKDLPSGLMVFGYPNQFSQALFNILSNAKESILLNRKEGGRIALSLSVVDGEVVLLVSDNGGGIAEDALPKVFDPYFTTKEQGSGIGLYMAKMILERNMNGHISIANQGEGVTVRIAFPPCEATQAG